MPDCYIDGTLRSWTEVWETCDVCGDLLAIHWRGRPCLQVTPDDSNGLETTPTK